MSDLAGREVETVDDGRARRGRRRGGSDAVSVAALAVGVAAVAYVVHRFGFQR